MMHPCFADRRLVDRRLADRRRCCAAVALLVAALGATGHRPLDAQVRLLEPPAVPASDVSEDFLTLSAGACAVRYRSGGLDRAHYVLRRLDLVTRQLNDWSEVPVPVAVYLLERSGWSQVGLQGVYGVPVRTGPTAVALAAEGDSGTVALWRALLEADAVPLVPGVPLRGTTEEAATLAIADVLLQVEAARGFVQRAGLLGDRAWIGDVVAHVAAVSIFQKHERSRLPEIAALFRRLRETTARGGGYSLDSFSPGPGPRDESELRRWLWYQAAFFEAAHSLVERHGRKAVPRLQKLAGDRRILREAELLAEFEELSAWRQRLAAEAP
jgi:hypothetical protein